MQRASACERHLRHRAALPACAALTVILAFALSLSATVGDVELDRRAGASCLRGLAPLEFSHAAPGLCTFKYLSGVPRPRGIDVVSAAGSGITGLVEDTLIVLLRAADARGTGAAPLGSVVALRNAAADSRLAVAEDPPVVLGRAPLLTHGLLSHGGFVYASSPTTVFRWPVVPAPAAAGSASAIAFGTRQTVLVGMPTGGHSSRIPAIGPDGMLYVSVGSAGNVDRDSSRARVRRFPLHRFAAGGDIPPLDWQSDGETYADGMRNEAALRFDQHGVLWGAENGVDRLARGDLGGDIHRDNPCEEVNDLGDPRQNASAGRFFGYPRCWSEHILSNNNKKSVPGRNWGHADFGGASIDPFCQNSTAVVPPAFCLPAHTAPLGIAFFEPPTPAHAFGGGVQPGDAVVALHGSWNRDPAQGYRVVHLRMSSLDSHPGTQRRKPVQARPLLWYDQEAGSAVSVGPRANAYPQTDDAQWPHRPVGVAFRECVIGQPRMCLFVTSDGSDTVMGVMAAHGDD
jgi:glucose/arabinose dehydrogenase